MYAGGGHGRRDRRAADRTRHGEAAVEAGCDGYSMRVEPFEAGPSSKQPQEALDGTTLRLRGRDMLDDAYRS